MPLVRRNPVLQILQILVQQTEEEDVEFIIRTLRAPGLVRHMRQKLVVELLRVGDVGHLVAVGGPSHFSHHDGQVGSSYLLQCRHHSIEHGVEDAVVGQIAYGIPHAMAAEEGVVGWKIRHVDEIDERVEVDAERSPRLVVRGDDVPHQRRDVGPECPR
ncbi:hypothetical protein Mapa_013054 [Marchantia paleacea]|nr:hypothetical protein Mapa_013054 [Marchantia paleacea]